MRIFGSKPGTYGAGLLQLMESRNWRDDADLAEVYTTWGGYAYGRGLDGVPARGAMEAAYRRIAVAAKNTDTREHDIADSDDYYQYHGGMVATVRALTGTAPAAYVGDSTRPEAVRTRTLHEETARVFRARVVNPRWMDAMRRHGYKGAFEMAATVDYLFGWDATTGVVADWQYEKLTAEYVLDPVNRKFLEESARVFRSRVVNPRWIQAMRRHGYKGAFELAATVDYLFGWDATTGVVADWMYERLAAAYVLDDETRQFMESSNPWALRGITERLLEAADRGLWAAPEGATLEALRGVYLEVEGRLEDAQA